MAWIDGSISDRDGSGRHCCPQFGFAAMESMRSRNDPEVSCPSCGRLGRWFSGLAGPFCSDRCRLIDLGKWFGEEHRVSRELRPGDFEGFDGLSSGPGLDRVDSQ
jgi:endogenous inhibitor of DNA gyrase (YacG/DUF329 family)